MLLGLGRGPPGRGPPGRCTSAGLGRPAGGRGPAGRAPGGPALAGPGCPGCAGCPGRGPRGAEPIPVAVELNGLFPGRGPGRGAPREPPGLGAPDRGAPVGAPPGRGSADRGADAGAVCGGGPATGGVPSTGTLGTGACGRVTAGAGPAAAGAGAAATVRSVAGTGPVACGLMSCRLIPAAGASTEGACGRAGPGRGALRPPFCPSAPAPAGTVPSAPAPAGTTAAGTAPVGTATAATAPAGTGATGAPSDGPAALGLRAWAFGAWAENSSLSLRTTGASIVDDAERTNSPISWSLAITALLSTPNSFASSYTRTFATALPLIGPAHPDHRGRSGAARAPAGVSFWCSSTRSHRALITTDPAFPAVTAVSASAPAAQPGRTCEGPSYCATRYSSSLLAPNGPGRRSARGNALRRCASSKHSWRGCRYAPRPGNRA
jgi:hypothetical protein